MAHRLSFLLVALCVLHTYTHTHTLTHAHNWMTSPMPRGGAKDNTVSPCEALTPTSKVTPVTKGDTLLVTWTDNHQDNNVHALAIAPFGEDGSASDYAELYSVKSGTASHELPSSTFSTYTVGSSYTLRYTWAGWDNCATLRVAAPAPAHAVPADAANVTQSPVNNQPLQDGDYVIMDQSVPVGVFNVYTEQTSCKSGYVEKDKSCVSKSSSGGGGGGMSGAGKGFLSLFIIMIVGIAGFAGYSYYKTGDALYAVRPLIAHARGKSSGKPATVADGGEGGRKTGNYSAYVEPGGDI